MPELTPRIKESQEGTTSDAPAVQFFPEDSSWLPVERIVSSGGGWERSREATSVLRKMIERGVSRICDATSVLGEDLREPTAYHSAGSLIAVGAGLIFLLLLVVAGVIAFVNLEAVTK
jgi:hypothetical protein